MSRRLLITVGKTSRGGSIAKRETSWPELAARLSKFKTLPVTLAEYASLSTDAKAELKNSTGFFIGGWFNDETRKKAALAGRSILTLDVDSLPAYELDGVQDVYKNITHCFHSSASHTDLRPKFRLVFPLSRDVGAEEYEPLARRVAAKLSIDAVDRVSYRPSQLMYFPAVCSDGVPASYVHEATWLNPDKVLAAYADWRDYGSWPASAAESEIRAVARTMEDPVAKGGVIGAFCTAYDIRRAIAEFQLPYMSTEHENRYTPVGATGSQGAVIYPSALCEAAFLYSHHSHDPAANRCLNSFDLVRHCKWPELPDPDSLKEMLALARSLDDVKDILEKRVTVDEFDVLPSEESVSERKEKVKAATVNYAFLSDKLENMANKRDSEAFRGEVKLFIDQLAGARLDPSDEDVLLGHLRAIYPAKEPKPSRAKLHADILKIRKKMTGSLENSDGKLTDIEIDIIKEFLHRYYGDGKHIRRVGRAFWVYERGCWRITEDEQVKGRLLDTITKLRTERPEDLMSLVAAVGESATSAIVVRLFSILPALVAQEHSDKDPLGLRTERSAIVNCLNGELCLDDSGVFRLLPHNPEHFLTSQVPVNYDPDALCPEWDDFCDYIFRDSIDPAAMRGHLEELGGYLVQPTRWLRTWVLFHGPTAAGKTTIGRVFGNLLGTSAAMRPLAAYDGRNTHAEAGLVGKLMLLDEDFDKGAMLPDGFIKKISEAKELTANPKGKDEFSFVCRALPVIISNSWPATRDLSDALIDRALVWHFDQQFDGSRRDDNKADTMVRGELAGILNRFLAGFERLRKRGEWAPPLECLTARQSWVTNSNSVGRFLSECAERAPAPAKTKGVDLWSAYRGWMADAMPGARKVGRNEFYDRCDQNLGARLKSNGEWYYHGVKILAEAITEF